MQTNILEYLDATARRVPEKLAFSNGPEGLTFREVHTQARAIGSGLLELGAAGEPVVVFMERHPKMVAGFFGVVYAGCFYVPIDGEMPSFRVELIFQQLKPRFVLCDEKTREQAQSLAPQGAHVLPYDQLAASAINEDALVRVRRNALDTDPIYIVFTSGSTGVPKGVAACHRSVLDYIERLDEVLDVTEDTIFGNQTPLYFDACLKELYSTIRCGSTTYLIPKQLFSFPVKLVEYLNEYKINTVCWVVSALTMISGFKVLDKHIPEYFTRWLSEARSFLSSSSSSGARPCPTPGLLTSTAPPRLRACPAGTRWTGNLPTTRCCPSAGPSPTRGFSS